MRGQMKGNVSGKVRTLCVNGSASVSNIIGELVDFTLDTVKTVPVPVKRVSGSNEGKLVEFPMDAVTTVPVCGLSGLGGEELRDFTMDAVSAVPVCEIIGFCG